MADVSFDGVTKSFGDTMVIPPLDLHVADGEFVALVGPSGCGKTTLLRMMAGLEAVDSGHIHIGSQDVTLAPPKARNVAMVFQNYALYPHMTVAENIGFGLRVRGLKPAQRQAAVQSAAEVLGLGQLLNRYPKQLSGGQRQRVAMGRAIVREPSVFLMDEPLSNLDAQLRNSMRQEIRQLQRRLAVTTLYVTHDQVEAMTMADRVVVLNKGVIQQVDSPEALYAQPANLFVAQFIGAPRINILPTSALPRPDWAPAGAQHVGIRPHQLRVADGFTDASDSLRWPAVVQQREPLGDVTWLHAEVAGQAIMLRDSELQPSTEGQCIEVSMRWSDAHCFSAQGQRLPA